MEKKDVVLVILNRETAEATLNKLNFDKVNLITVLADGGEKILQIGNKNVPRIAPSHMNKAIKDYKEALWLIAGCLNGVDDLLKMKKFLSINGVPEKNIVNFEISSQISETWLANLHHIEEHGADFFVTGNEFMRDGFNMKYIPCLSGDKNSTLGGVNLADAGQDLRQAYLTAKYVFAHVEPGTIKFVFIGLALDSFQYDNAQKSFGFQHFLALVNSTTEESDPNFDKLRKQKREFSIKAIIDWEDAKSPTNDSLKANVKILKNYIELCLANDAKPIGVLLPCSNAIQKTCDKEFLKSFRKTIHQFEESHDFIFFDMFNCKLNYDYFYNLAHLNSKGASLVSSMLTFNLSNKNLIPIENFCNMPYEYFYTLSDIAPKDEYNAFMKRVFEISVDKIRRKEKVKLGFVLYDSSMWSGDDLYNLFAQDERFEVTVFLCMRIDKRIDKANEELFQKNFLHGLELFKSHGLNVVAVDNFKAKVPAQDVLFFLTPYFKTLPRAFRFEFLTANSLVIHIPYAFDTATRKSICVQQMIFRVLWKLFFPSVSTLEMYDEYCPIGVPYGIYSGYPKMDIFFKSDSKFHFDWKMAHPNAKKIIWAPHWSINDGVKYATFQWNYQFMYEFAKAHPETSWIVKPHPNLFFSAVSEGVFPTVEAFKEYLQKWDDLPNAQVYTGGYYQAIFATSDGLIHDCGSFTIEYQYVNKPMIYLTRSMDRLNKLGKKILKASYLVDGKDLESIAELMQKVFIEGDDYKAAERKEAFDKYLNYPKDNGMLASEFIYKNLAEELREADGIDELEKFFEVTLWKK